MEPRNNFERLFVFHYFEGHVSVAPFSVMKRMSAVSSRLGLGAGTAGLGLDNRESRELDWHKTEYSKRLFLDTIDLASEGSFPFSSYFRSALMAHKFCSHNSKI